MKKTTLRALALSASLAIAWSSPASAQCTDDVFEPNDSCGQVVALPVGIHAGLTLYESDFFRIDVPAGNLFIVEFEELSGNSSFFVNLYPGDGGAGQCSPVDAITGGWVQNGPIQLAWQAPANSAESFILEVIGFSFECIDYDMSLSFVVDPCAGISDDTLEPNDSCGQQLSLTTGSYPGLFTSVSDLDLFEITAAPGELITMEVYPAGGAELAVDLWLDTDCSSNPIYGAFMHLGHPVVYLINDTLAPISWIARVRPVPDQQALTGFCAIYDIEVSSTTDPCGAATGDVFEENDSCENAAAIAGDMDSSNTYLGDPDWYEVVVPGDGSLSLLLEPAVPYNNFIMHLYGICTTGFLASGNPVTPGSNILELNWVNPDPTPRTVRVLAVMSAPSQEFCTEYDLRVRPTLGTPFCTVGPNSTGEPALIRALGSNLVGSGALSLEATNVPPNQFGLFFCGPNEISPQSFGNGFRCIAGNLFRLQPTLADAAGLLATDVDWSNPGPAGVIISGSTWHVQAWYRDPQAAGASFDLSDGLRIQFH